jgi:hypothetical protein
VHSEGVQLQRGGFGFFPCPSSFCSVTPRLQHYVSAQLLLGTAKARGEDDRDVSSSTLLAFWSASTTPV